MTVADGIGPARCILLPLATIPVPATALGALPLPPAFGLPERHLIAAMSAGAVGS